MLRFFSPLAYSSFSFLCHLVRFVPLLPRGSLDLLRADCPFIVGVNSYLMQSITVLPGVVIADLDKNVVKYKPGNK